MPSLPALVFSIMDFFFPLQVTSLSPTKKSPDVFTHSHKQIHTQICTNTHAYTNTHVQRHTHIHTQVYTHKFIQIHTNKHTDANMYRCKHVHIHAQIYTRPHISSIVLDNNYSKSDPVIIFTIIPLIHLWSQNLEKGRE